MSAGDSVVSICNLALGQIGEYPISSLTDQRKAAILCGQFYDPCRRQLLEEQPWKFAKAQAQLAASTTAPLFTYDNAYLMPADFLRMLDEPEEDNPQYEIMGGQILSNDRSPFEMLYVRDVTDPTLFSALFVKVLSLRLAADLARSLAQNDTMAQELDQKAEAMLDKAALVNGQEESSQTLDEDVWLRARY